MDLLLLGLNHRTASVSARGSVAAWVGSDAAAWLRQARDHAGVAELALLATCHRVEVYAAAEDVSAAERGLRAMLTPVPASGEPPEDECYVRTGVDVVAHVCHVACGLDSLIVGESEIAGQVRRAAVQARAAGTMGPYLEAAMAGALAASGRARSETRIAQGVLSAASASVALACAEFGSLAQRTLLVVGAGQTGRLVLSRVARMPHGRLIVASRSDRHARDAAADAGGTPASLGDIPDVLRDVDVAIVAVQAPEAVMARAVVEQAMAARPDRPLLLIDLSVPRSIAADVAAISGVRLRTVDDLGDIARASTAQRAAEIPLVEAIAHDEARRAYRRVTARRHRTLRG